MTTPPKEPKIDTVPKPMPLILSGNISIVYKKRILY